jgi:hypothetical protein
MSNGNSISDLFERHCTRLGSLARMRDEARCPRYRGHHTNIEPTETLDMPQPCLDENPMSGMRIVRV